MDNYTLIKNSVENHAGGIAILLNQHSTILAVSKSIHAYCDINPNDFLEKNLSHLLSFKNFKLPEINIEKLYGEGNNNSVISINGKNFVWSLMSLNTHLEEKLFILIGNKTQSFNLGINESKFLKEIINSIPQYIFWKDKNSVFLGCNDNFAQLVGLSDPDEIIGKTDYDLSWTEEQSADFCRDDKQVIETGIPKLFYEEKQLQPDGKEHIVLVSKIPHISENTVTGLVCIYQDITDKKEAEHLKLENQMHKQALQEQRKFTQIANQVAHDIRSPLASLLMIVKSCSEIPEAERIALREAAISIGDIANNLLSQYTHKNTDLAPESQANQPMLVSATLMQLLTDKKYEYQNLPVKLTHEFSQKGHFAFIKISISDFKRMISNLINNAKEAFHFSNGKKAKISVNLDATNEWVTISIQDNGKGMSPELIRKIKQNIAVSEGKNAGYGIGLTQVRDTLRRHQGEICITSEVGQGTKILLTFPRFKAPNWIGEEIKLGKEDIIVILDDDASIHSAWDTKLDSLLKTTPSLQIKHFHQGREALNFLNSLAPEEKEKVFLLTDFELLKQELNGLTVIKKSGITRSLLVTSHYVKPFLRDQAARIGTKILPKQLASEINILIDSDIQYKNIEAKHIDLIIVDDDKRFSDSLTRRLFLDKKVDHYLDPYHFLKQVTRYPKNTKILLDNHFATNMTGIELAEKLHEIGYTSLYLLSGDTFKKSELPIYLTVIRKDDISSIKKLNNE